jgi:hypothetical protein
MPDISGAMPADPSYAGESADVMSQVAPAPRRMEETRVPRSAAAALASPVEDPEEAALNELASDMPARPEVTQRPIQPLARPESQVRPDDSMEADDDSPDALHAMVNFGNEDEVSDEPAPRSIVGEEQEPIRPAPAEPAAALASPVAPDDDPELAALDQMSGKPERDVARDEAAGPLPRLDDDLPTEGEIQTARDWDVPRSIFRSLQNGLLGAIGRPRREYEGEGDALQARRTAGLERRSTSKQSTRHEERLSAQAQAQRESTEALQRAQLAESQRNHDLQDENADATRATLAPTRAASAELSGARADVLRDPSAAASEESQGEQHAVSAALADLRAADPALADRVLADTGIDPANIATMSARELRPLILAIREARRGERAGGGGRRGTGGGAGRGTGASSSSLEDWIQQGHTRLDLETTPREELEAVARRQMATLPATGPRSVESVLAADFAEDTAAPLVEEGREAMLAERTEADSPTLREGNMANTLSTFRRLASTIRQYPQGDIPGIGPVDGRVPTEALMASGQQEALTVRRQLETFMLRYLRQTSGAQITPAEAAEEAAILSALDERQFRAALLEREADLRAMATGDLEGDGPPPPRATPARRAGPRARAPSSSGGSVMMTLPSGTRRPIRADQVEEAMRRGAVRADGP